LEDIVLYQLLSAEANLVMMSPAFSSKSVAR